MPARSRNPLRRLQFRDPAQEERFRALHAAEMAQRSRLYVPVAMIVVLGSAIGHLLLFPQFVWIPSLSLLAVFMLLPLALTWRIAHAPDAVPRIYRSVYLTAVSASLGVCLLIASARMQGYPMPYEGTLLVMMCVFLVSGLRAFDSSLSAFICLAGLAIVEWTWPLSLGDAITRTFFGSTLWMLGGVFSVVIESSLRRDFRHRERLNILAQQDPMTGALNRRGLDARYAGIAATARREKRPITFALIDIDHFKAYNDSYGHDGGDATLVAVSRILAGHARRPLDLYARLGGEEFLIVWYDVDATRALELAEELCTAVVASALPHCGAPRGIVTISAGVATGNPPESFDALYRQADQALYAAKNGGRNQAQAHRAEPDA
ncbi:MAG: diguanylate cyclase [Pseudomonadota bacterium]